MIIEERFVVAAPIEKVWKFLLDANKMSSCVPGCEGVETIDENTYLTGIKVKVGLLSARFKIRLTITEKDPPHRMLTIGKGEDSKMASSLLSKNEITLKDISERETEIHYRSDVSVLGTLGRFGEGVMREKAKEVGKQFAGSLRAKIEM